MTSLMKESRNWKSIRESGCSSFTIAWFTSFTMWTKSAPNPPQLARVDPRCGVPRKTTPAVESTTSEYNSSGDSSEWRRAFCMTRPPREWPMKIMGRCCWTCLDNSERRQKLINIPSMSLTDSLQACYIDSSHVQWHHFHLDDGSPTSGWHRHRTPKWICERMICLLARDLWAKMSWSLLRTMCSDCRLAHGQRQYCGHVSYQTLDS